MFCGKCGQQNPDSGSFCIKCGHSLQGLPTAPQTQVVPASSVIPESMFSSELSPQSQAAGTSPKPHKKSRVGLFVGLAAGGLVLITVLLTLFLGVIPMLNRESRNRVAETEASSSESTLDDNQGVTAPTTAETTSSVDLYAKAMEKYIIMDPVTFDALPRLDRLPYSKYLVDKTIASGEYDLAYGVGTAYEKYRLSYTEVSKENTGQQIINNDMLTTQIAFLQSMNNNKAKIDPIKLEEVLSLNYYEVGSDEKTLSNAYLGIKDFADTLTNSTASANINTVTNTSELMEGVDNEGNKISYKIITWHDQTKVETYARFFYCEYKSYDGSDEAVWLLDVQDGSPLLD